MPAKKRATQPTGPVDLYSARGTKITVPADAVDLMKSMGFMTAPASPGDLDSESTPPEE